MFKHLSSFLFVSILMPVYAAEPVPEPAKASITDGINSADMSALDNRVEDIKKEVLDLNRDLFILEEQLLFPSNTRFGIYLSIDVGEYFTLESVRVLLDNKPVTSYLYNERESQALYRGGVQRLHIGNLTSGEHELVAYYTGKGPRGRDFKRAVSKKVTKGLGPRYVELKISDNQGTKQADFFVKDWKEL